MNGIKPNFLKDSQLNPSYYEPPNPYVNVPSCYVNLLELKSSLIYLQKKLRNFPFEIKRNRILFLIY